MNQACVVIFSCVLSWGIALNAHAHTASDGDVDAQAPHETAAAKNADGAFNPRTRAKNSSNSDTETAETRSTAAKLRHSWARNHAAATLVASNSNDGSDKATPSDSAPANGASWNVAPSNSRAQQPNRSQNNRENRDDSVATTTNNDSLTDFDSYSDALAHAENAFAFGAYETVIDTLAPWLYPDPVQDAVGQNTEDGYAWLGAAAWFIDAQDDAAHYFATGLRRHPSMTLDPLVFSPALIDFFQRVRDALDLEDPEETNGADDNTLYIESRISEHPLWVSLLPFGYGMFVNDKPEWGAIYALTEGALLTVSAATFWVNYAKRLPSDDPNHPMGYADPERAKMRKRLHIGTGSAFLAVVLVNVIHGALIHKQTRQVQYRTLSAPPEGFDIQEQSERSRRSERNQHRWNIRIGPFSNTPSAPLSTW